MEVWCETCLELNLCVQELSGQLFQECVGYLR
jgi:hypothetical protein